MRCFLAAVFAVHPLGGVADEKQIADVKEIAGSWQGWVTGELGQERATMIVQANGSYKASTTRGSTAEGLHRRRNGWRHTSTIVRRVPDDAIHL